MQRTNDLVIPSAAPPRQSSQAPTVAVSAWQDAEVACKYVGTFESGTKVNKTEVKAGILNMKAHCANARPAILFISLEGVKVIDALTQQVAMAHALMRVAMSSADAENKLFGFVAKNPGDKRYFTHVFLLRRNHAEEVQVDS